MLEKIKDFLTNDKELDSGWQKFLSLIFLLIAAIMCLPQYKCIHNIFGWTWESGLQFRPSLISAIVGIVLISPLYLRNILKWNKSIYTIISLVLILFVFSSFVELATGGNNTNDIVYSLIGISVLLSWLGIRGVAGISWILVLASAVYFVMGNNTNLGIYGFLYICSGFLGLLMHTGLSPGMFIKGIKEEYAGATVNTKNKIKDEIEKTLI